VLAACGTLLIAAGVVAWTTGGFAFSLGPLHVSATDPARLFMEGCLALLAWAAVALERPDKRAALIVTCLVMAYYVALVAESSTRRVGDGHEYIAMARQLSSTKIQSRSCMPSPYRGRSFPSMVLVMKSGMNFSTCW